MVELLWSLIFFSAAMTLTPGPNVIMVTATAANFGMARTFPQILGITLGFATLVAATAVGFANIFEAEPRLHLALKYAGAAYLVYLAWCIAGSQPRGEASQGAPIGPLQAAFLQWVNPKGWILAVGALAAFTTSDGDLFLESTIVGAVITFAVFLSVVIWAFFGVAISRFLAGARARRVFNWAMASSLILSLVPVFW